MKKCPYCKAEIEENARFCLYCMKPLNEKNGAKPLEKKQPRWPFAVIGVLVAAIILLIALKPKDTNSAGETPSVETITTVGSTESSQGVEETQAENIPTNPMPDSPNTEPSAPEQQENYQNADETTPPLSTPTEPQDATPTTPPSEDPGTEPTTPPSEDPGTEPTTPPSVDPTDSAQDPSVEETEPEVPQSQVIYRYRAAQAGDDFSANYQNSGNDIVITGISQPSIDGVYDIPAYIDGKKVIAITANAFSGSNATVVYVPATLKTIWNHAFAGCGLRDIYFRGNGIYAEGKAFPAGITIHCSASCSDRNFRYYKNTATNYDATWEEWNG